MPKISREQLDKDERKILAMLQKNSNMSTDLIAKHCGVSRQTVYRTIKQLVKKRMIWGYTAIIDEQKQDLQKFMLLLKRSHQPLDKKTVDKIATRRSENLYSELGITIESNYYLHGEYDWAIIFTTKDLRQAKKFSNAILQNYPGVVANLSLMQMLYAQREHSILNPNPMQLMEFL